MGYADVFLQRHENLHGLRKVEVDDNSFGQKVRNIDWAKYLAPEYYDPDKMNFDPDRLVKTLIALNNVSEFNLSDGFLSDVRYALGNDHRGTYYPAALEAIDLIIEIEKYSDNEKARSFAKLILNDLYYFQLEMSFENKDLFDLIDNSISEKLKPYSDEHLA